MNDRTDIHLSYENGQIKLKFEKNGFLEEISRIEGFIEHCKYHKSQLKSSLPSYRREESLMWARLYTKYLIFKTLIERVNKNEGK